MRKALMDIAMRFANYVTRRHLLVMTHALYTHTSACHQVHASMHKLV